MKTMKRGGDPMFLQTAALAGVSGVGCIAAAIGLPVWNWMHGGHASPVFFYFSLWGAIALMGAAANLHVYFQTIPPNGPPLGGNRNATVTSLDVRRHVNAELTEQAKAA